VNHVADADGKRNRILPEKVEMLLFLNKSLLLLNFDYYQILVFVSTKLLTLPFSTATV